MRLSEVQLRMVEQELHRMVELSTAIASDASFLAFTLIMSGDDGRDAGRELALTLDERTIGALRAACRTITGVEGRSLDDAELLQTLADATMQAANVERAAQAFGFLARGPSRASSGGRRGGH